MTEPNVTVKVLTYLETDPEPRRRVSRFYEAATVTEALAAAALDPNISEAFRVDLVNHRGYAEYETKTILADPVAMQAIAEAEAEVSA